MSGWSVVAVAAVSRPIRASFTMGTALGFKRSGLPSTGCEKPGRIVLVGFDFRGGYFFGSHPRGAQLANQIPQYMPFFEKAAKSLPEGVEIVNATPNSALECFPMMGLSQALA